MKAVTSVQMLGDAYCFQFMLTHLGKVWIYLFFPLILLNYWGEWDFYLWLDCRSGWRKTQTGFSFFNKWVVSNPVEGFGKYIRIKWIIQIYLVLFFIYLMLTRFVYMVYRNIWSFFFLWVTILVFWIIVHSYGSKCVCKSSLIYTLKKQNMLGRMPTLKFRKKKKELCTSWNAAISPWLILPENL